MATAASPEIFRLRPESSRTEGRSCSLGFFGEMDRFVSQKPHAQSFPDPAVMEGQGVPQALEASLEMTDV